MISFQPHLRNDIAAAKAQIPFLYRVRVALEWTIKYYLLSLIVLLAGSLTVLVTVIVLDKLKLLPVARVVE